MHKHTLRLFHAVEIASTNRKTYTIDDELLKRTVARGFVFSPLVITNYTASELNDLVNIVEKEVGLTAEKANASFHKSWEKVRSASMLQLLLEQMIHYMTTYGFEALNIYNEDSVYIPAEKLDLPELKNDVQLTVIHGLTTGELREKLLKFLESGIALSDATREDVLTLAMHYNINDEEIARIKNREVLVALCDFTGSIPKDPVEFLRYAVYKHTRKTLLIKNAATIAAIKAEAKAHPAETMQLFARYERVFGSLAPLSQIFYRFKPLFLAFKQSPQTTAHINAIRRFATKYHQPMRADYMNSVTAITRKGRTPSRVVLTRELNKVNTFRKIRLAYALKYRLQDPDSIMYRVRNGKSYATDFHVMTIGERDAVSEAYKQVRDAIVEDLCKKVNGRRVCLPSNVDYALPATEKQFTGQFPSGTCVRTTEDMIVGVHWNNVEHNRIDLDLSLMTRDGKIGWDRMYRTEDRDILFSGDVTDAPGKKGASELFYVKKNISSANLLMLNYFNFYGEAVPVPMTIFVAQETIGRMSMNYTVDPNNMIAIAKSVIDKQQIICGLLVTSLKENRFYFAETSIGASRTSYGNEYVQHARDYLFSMYENTISLNQLLEFAGANIVDTAEDAEIDLSVQQIDKTKIIELLS